MPRHFSGRRLRQARHQAGRSDHETAAAIGRSLSLIHLVECGHRIPAAETLDRWCQYLGVPIDSCFVDDDAQAPV
jgi:transcriptional regulator with XRE-family HTH domain